MTTEIVLFGLIGGALAGIIGALLRAWSDAEYEEEELPSEKIKYVIHSARLSLGLLTGALSGLIFSLELSFAGEGTFFSVVAAVGFSYAATDMVRLLKKFGERLLETPTTGTNAMAGTSILIKYYSKFERGTAASCSIRIENLPIIRLSSTRSANVEIPENMFNAPNGLRVRFLIKFPKGRAVGAVARVWQPKGIFLDQSKFSHVTGTIQAEQTKSLSAAATVRECEITCIPPAREKPGPASCVICEDEDGTFELCC